MSVSGGLGALFEERLFKGPVDAVASIQDIHGGHLITCTVPSSLCWPVTIATASIMDEGEALHRILASLCCFRARAISKRRGADQLQPPPLTAPARPVKNRLICPVQDYVLERLDYQCARRSTSAPTICENLLAP